MLTLSDPVSLGPTHYQHWRKGTTCLITVQRVSRRVVSQIRVLGLSPSSHSDWVVLFNIDVHTIKFPNLSVSLMNSDTCAHTHAIIAQIRIWKSLARLSHLFRPPPSPVVTSCVFPVFMNLFHPVTVFFIGCSTFPQISHFWTIGWFRVRPMSHVFSNTYVNTDLLLVKQSFCSVRMAWGE